MILDCKESQYFFEVLRATIKGAPVPDPPELNWRRFLDTVKEQQFVSLVADSLGNKQLPPDVAFELKRYKNSEFTRILSVQNEFQEIKEMLVGNGIRYMPLKGSIIKKFYPKQSYRQMSDVDLMVDLEYHDVICDYMLGRGYDMVSDGGNTDDFHKKPYFTFEFHHDLFKDVYGFCPDFSFVWQNAEQNAEDGFEYDMSPEDMYLHSVAHMYKHFILGGFGIKFIVDNYLILTNNQDSWNRPYIDERLEQMKIADFEQQVAKASFDFFDDNLSVAQEKFFQRAFRYGTFVNAESMTNVAEIYNNYKKENGGSVAKYLFMRIFPSAERIKSMYPILVKKPYLLPWFYLKRLFVKLFKSPKKIKRELNYIIKSKKNKE